MGPEQRATIYDVARVAGVASSTVSRAFSRPSRINAQTVQRVLEVAASLGYSPNQTARGLSTGRTGNVGMVVPNIGNPFFTQFMRSFHEVAAQRRFSVHLIDTDENAEEEIRRIDGALSQVDGFALVSPRMGQAELREVVGRGRFVLVNRKVEDFPCIWVDSRPALREALQDLAALGHRSLVYVRGPAGGYSDTIRRSIVRQLARSARMKLTFTSAQRDERSSAVAAVQLAGEVGATAVIAHSDAAAVALILECREHGINVPGDLSVLGHDDIDWASVVFPALTTISAQTHVSGRWSANTLIDMIEDPVANRAEVPRTSVVATYVRRESLGPARDR